MFLNNNMKKKNYFIKKKIQNILFFKKFKITMIILQKVVEQSPILLTPFVN